VYEAVSAEQLRSRKRPFRPAKWFHYHSLHLNVHCMGSSIIAGAARTARLSLLNIDSTPCTTCGIAQNLYMSTTSATCCPAGAYHNWPLWPINHDQGIRTHHSKFRRATQRHSYFQRQVDTRSIVTQSEVNHDANNTTSIVLQRT
jgi:hypothetical protein